MTCSFKNISYVLVVYSNFLFLFIYFIGSKKKKIYFVNVDFIKWLGITLHGIYIGINGTWKRQICSFLLFHTHLKLRFLNCLKNFKLF